MTALEQLFYRAYPPLQIAYDDLVDDHVDLLMAYQELEEKYAIAKGFLKQALIRTVAAETRLAQLAGTTPWHDDPS